MRPSLAVAAALVFFTAGATASADEPEPAAEPSTLGRPRGVLFDGNVGIPKASAGKSSAAFDVTTGYIWQRWGLEAYLSQYSYYLDASDTVTVTEKTRFGVHLRYLSGDASHDKRLEFRAEIDGGDYYTSYSQLPNSAGGGVVTDRTEVSSIARASFLLGYRMVPSPDTRAFLMAGGGLQNDYYSKSGFTSGTGIDQGSDSKTTTSESFRILARAGAWKSLVSGTLSVRPELEVSRFSLQRSEFAFASNSDTFTTTDPSPKSFTQIEAKGRFFGHAEVLTFWGLSPVAFVGFDFFRLSGDGKTVSSFIPIAGAGIANAIPVDY